MHSFQLNKTTTLEYIINQHFTQYLEKEKSAFFTIYSVKMTLVPN